MIVRFVVYTSVSSPARRVHCLLGGEEEFRNIAFSHPNCSSILQNQLHNKNKQHSVNVLGRRESISVETFCIHYDMLNGMHELYS